MLAPLPPFMSKLGPVANNVQRPERKKVPSVYKSSFPRAGLPTLTGKGGGVHGRRASCRWYFISQTPEPNLDRFRNTKTKGPLHNAASRNHIKQDSRTGVSSPGEEHTHIAFGKTNEREPNAVRCGNTKTKGPLHNAASAPGSARSPSALRSHIPSTE